RTASAAAPGPRSGRGRHPGHLHGTTGFAGRKKCTAESTYTQGAKLSRSRTGGHDDRHGADADQSSATVCTYIRQHERRAALADTDTPAGFRLRTQPSAVVVPASPALRCSHTYLPATL